MGNCGQYVRTWQEVKENQMKRFHGEQNQIAYMKNYTVWLSHGKASYSADTQQGEDTTENDDIRTDRESCEWEDTVILFLTMWNDPSTHYHGAKCHFK